MMTQDCMVPNSGLPVYNPNDIATIVSKKRVVEVMLALPLQAADVVVKYYSHFVGRTWSFALPTI